MPNLMLDQIDIDTRQVWLRAFYGFGPEDQGYLGFTHEADRTAMMTKMRDGDLVLIYGAANELTDTDLKRQVLGFLEITLEECVDVDRMGSDSIQWRKAQGFEGRWNFGIKVRRAWRALNRVHVRNVAPNAYHNDHRFTRTTRAMLLDPEERRRALTHAVRQVNVFGEPSIADSAMSTGPLGKLLRPSRGIPPRFGEHTVSTVDGENHLYLMAFSGGAEFLLGKSGDHGGQALIKIGRSNDPTRRLDEINAGFPVNAVHQWRLIQQQTFADGATTHQLEDDLKALFASSFRSQGGEFFTGELNAIKDRFQQLCIASMPIIIGAPGKAKGVK